ncbi:hypothetical protein DM01DRAFT_1333858 [Hesseltinella vesiculosa]|uniref:Pyridoxamine 5'-phosphate oxidase Alr4036 family FMN-binding domain-containing protein n=1 Tax=Hesseltinella vesiculosa TaxID=101127 RepID=A0A1X2GNY5_9FUNG|nr:hypothetical protein DM01DRAFT_1333858 [Hesseltinella vesiculosa]
MRGLESCYMSLALAGPSVRTVVCRGFAGQHHREDLGWMSNVLLVTTAKNSLKVSRIQEWNKYEICWYMFGTQEQFRLTGHVHVFPPPAHTTPHDLPEVTRVRTVAPDQVDLVANKSFLLRQSSQPAFDWEAERRRQFALLDDVLRASFCDSLPASSRLAITGLDSHGWFTSDNQAALDAAYANFCILLLTVDHMDYLSLAGDHRQYPASL